MNINPRFDKRYKRLKHSSFLIIEPNDILQMRNDYGNIEYILAKDIGAPYIGMSTLTFRFPNCHRAVWRLKTK